MSQDRNSDAFVAGLGTVKFSRKMLQRSKLIATNRYQLAVISESYCFYYNNT